MSEELKPCPFCGGKAQLHITSWGNVTWVECTRCFAMGERACEGDVKKQAIEAWNRREIDDYVIKLETDLEKAREQIEYLKDNRMAE